MTFRFFNMKVCCVFSLESPHRGDSNDNAQCTIFNLRKKLTLNFPKSEAVGFFFQGTQERVRNSCGGEPSVFEPSKFQYSKSIVRDKCEPGIRTSVLHYMCRPVDRMISSQLLSYESAGSGSAGGQTFGPAPHQ